LPDLDPAAPSYLLSGFAAGHETSELFRDDWHMANKTGHLRNHDRDRGYGGEALGASRVIRTPDRFDVIVTTNMLGDILSGEVSGSLGLGGSINAGGGIRVAQAQHGAAPDIARVNRDDR
jgi:hypothetical protein